jgi:hypothetical protein
MHSSSNFFIHLYKDILILIFFFLSISHSFAQSELKTIHVGKNNTEKTRQSGATGINPQLNQYKFFRAVTPNEWSMSNFRPPCQVEKLSTKEIILSKEYRKIVTIPDSLLFYSATLYLFCKDSIEEINIKNDTLNSALIQKIHAAKKSVFIDIKFRTPLIKNSTITTYKVPGFIAKYGTIMSNPLLLNLWEKDKFAKHPKIIGTTIIKTYVRVVGGKNNNKEYVYNKAKIDRNELPCDAQYYLFEFDLYKQEKKYSRNFTIRGNF